MNPIKLDFFVRGMGFTAALFMLIQDWMGLEGYIEYLRGAWINLPWWVGGGLALLIGLVAFIDMKEGK